MSCFCVLLCILDVSMFTRSMSVGGRCYSIVFTWWDMTINTVFSLFHHVHLGLIVIFNFPPESKEKTLKLE